MKKKGKQLVTLAKFVPRRNSLALAATMSFLAVLSSTRSRAAVVAFDFSSSLQNTIGFTTDQDFGYEFSPIADILVTTLLVWDSNGDDFVTLDADVAIWDVANPGTPVVAGSITVAGAPTEPSASSTIGIWRVVDVPDTLLTGGVTYRLAADGFFGTDYGRTTALTTILNGITLSSPNPGVESTAGGSGWLPGPEYPDLASAQIWATASFTYLPVPEPSVFLTLSMASGVLCLSRRRAVPPAREAPAV